MLKFVFFFPNLQLNEVTFCTTDSSLTVMNLVQRKDMLSAHVYYVQNTKKEELANQYSTLKHLHKILFPHSSSFGKHLSPKSTVCDVENGTG